MSTVVSADKKQKSKLFETVLSSPGMTESCKISLKISRQNVLRLCRLIEVGILSPKSAIDDDILTSFPDQSEQDFKLVLDEILQHAGLTDFYERIKTL